VLDIIYDPPSRKGTEYRRKPLKWVVFDSFIVAVIYFLSMLPTYRLPDIIDLYRALLSFANAFVLQIIIEYKVKPYLRKNKGGG